MEQKRQVKRSLVSKSRQNIHILQNTESNLGRKLQGETEELHGRMLLFGKPGQLPGKDGNAAVPSRQSRVPAGGQKADLHHREEPAGAMAQGPKGNSVSWQEQATWASVRDPPRSNTTNNYY